MTRDSPQVRFQTLLERHRGSVLRLAGVYGRSAEERRDLAQEIRAQLWRAFFRYDERLEFSTWMYRIALNVAISFARGAGADGKRSLSLDDDGAPASGEHGFGPDDERVLFLQRFIAGLDDPSRALLLLYLEGLSYREIAEVLGISETGVATKLHRLELRIQREARGEARR